MAELDPNIILQSKPVQIASPFDLASGAMQLRNLGIQGQNQQISLEQNQRSLKDQKTIADLYRANVDPTTGAVNHAGVVQGLAQAGLGDKIPAYQQGVATASKDTTAAEAAQFDLHKKKLDVTSNAIASLLSKPDVNQQDVIGAISGLVNGGIIDANTGAQMSRQIPGRPEQLRPWLMQKGLETQDVAKQIEARLSMAPKYNAQDTGAVINQGTVDPLTGVRTAGANVAKTMTPDEAAKIKLAKEQGFSTDEGNLFGAIAMRGISLPAGLRSKAQMKATAQSLIAQNPGLTVDEIADKLATGQISFAADKKVSTTAAGIEGKISYAENEIKNIMPLVREAAAAVPRSQFVPWNKLSQYADSQISNPELKTLKSYMTTLSNAYDMLAARGGTDMDKRKHNRAMFDTADGPEAMEAAFKAVENEAAISGKAGQASMAPVSRVTQHGSGTTPPADIQALLDKHGGK